jgi:hypothetical protein
VQRLPVERDDLDVAELRLGLPCPDPGPAARGALAVVRVVDDAGVVEPDLDARALAPGADAVPAARLDRAVVALRDAAPAVLALHAVEALVPLVGAQAEPREVWPLVVEGLGLLFERHPPDEIGHARLERGVGVEVGRILRRERRGER